MLSYQGLFFLFIYSSLALLIDLDLKQNFHVYDRQKGASLLDESKRKTVGLLINCKTRECLRTVCQTVGKCID